MVSVTGSGNVWGKVSESTIWGLKMAEKGAEVISSKLWRDIWKILLRCVIFADVHYILARVKKINGITVFAICLWRIDHLLKP